MKKFTAAVKIGTKVKLEGLDGWHLVKSFENDRRLITVENLEGCFHRAHVERFTNK